MQPDFVPALKDALTKAIVGLSTLDGTARLSGGASQETWSFDAVTPSGRIPLILRRSPGGATRVVTEGAPAVSLANEARTIEAARATGAKVPRVRYVLVPEDGVGDGYVMERLSGETIARKILRDKEFDSVRPKLARQCGEVLARIHQVDTAPLMEYLPVIDGPTQLRQFRDRYDTYDYPHPVFELAFKWLEPRLAGAKRQTLVHGDFRNGNILISPNGVEAALDWELTHIGDPLEDIGWICTNSWRFGVQKKTVGGFGELQDLLGGYESGGGERIDLDDVRTWIVFGSLKWGVMCMSMYQGFRIDGSVERATIGRRSSETEIDLVNLIIRGEL